MIDKKFPPSIKRLPGGVIHILVNTTEKWCPYDLNPVVPADGYVDLSFTDEPWAHRGIAPDMPPIESVLVGDGFRAINHVVTSMQVKDQITIVCIPKRLLLDTPSTITTVRQ